MRRPFSYANVAATMALVFSMSGGALAASHYLINSTKQINPKVLKKLVGKSGASGAAGKEGPQGKEGAKGERGPQGEKGLPGEKGESGASHAWSAETGEGVGTATVHVPEGRYVVFGEGSFYNEGKEYGAGQCIIEAPGNSFASDHQEATVPNNGEEERKFHEVHGSMGISTQGTATLNSAGSITEKCENATEAKQGVLVLKTRLIAIQVSGLN